MAKNLFVAYVLWFFGGWFGLHHFYLGRDRQAFAWWATAGGFFGIGWIRDLWRIPEYVDDANDEPGYVAELGDKMRRRATPPFNATRFIGEFSVGLLFGFLARVAIPEEWIEGGHRYLGLLGPFGVAVGVHMVANIGREVGSMKMSLLGAYSPLVFTMMDPTTTLQYGGLFSVILVNWKGKSWRRTPRKKHICKRLAILTLCAALYGSMWLSCFYHNVHITTGDGEKIKVKDALQNFFNSPAWAQTKQTMRQLWDYYKVHGWKKVAEEFVVALDPEGEQNAYKVLGIQSSATEKEIKAAYRELAKKWHPDKQSDPALKQEAEDRFIKIQKAYETLSSIQSRRARKNKTSRREG